ncbi:nucleolin-like [Ostrinia nubilalis]|uniref:nucleolin-like n=1 Tax=Ostrinia nubilalis TaxID=29057 RepID=UPI0030825FB2
MRYEVLLSSATPAAPADDERSRVSDDNDSADLLDSETEPCLVTDPGEWLNSNCYQLYDVTSYEPRPSPPRPPPPLPPQKTSARECLMTMTPLIYWTRRPSRVLLPILVLLSSATPAAPADDERSRVSDDNDSADLLDSETEPCLVTDPEDERSRVSDDNDSADLLDSETEPCLVTDPATPLAPATATPAAPAEDERSRVSDDNDSADLLDSETEPCLVTDPAAPVIPATLADDERSRVSDDNDSADLLDSETEPCLVTDPECAEEWWSGAEGAEGPAWSGDELSPERESVDIDADKDPESASASERDSLRNLSAAIAQRHRSEAEDLERGSLLERVLTLDNRLSDLLRALQLAAAAAATSDDAASAKLAAALKDKLDLTEKNVADVVVKKLAELDASKNLMEQYRQSIEALKKQVAQSGEEEELEFIEEELASCSESERRVRYEALDAALQALHARPRAIRSWPRLRRLQRDLELLAFAVVAPAPPARPQPAPPPPQLPSTA